MMARSFVPRSLRMLCILLASALIAHGEEEKPHLPPGVSLPDRSLFLQGRYLYEQHCIVCHGKRGDGKGDMAEQLAPKPRNFKLGLFKYRSTPWGKLPTDDDLLRTIREGRTGTAMGMFSHLRESEQRALAEYIKFFSRKWRDAENYAAPLPEPELPEWFSDVAERNRHADAGQKTFSTICASCHGPDADGHGPAAAGLKDEAGNAITPADLRQPRLRSGNELSDIYRVLMTGLNGTPMVSFAEALSEEQRWDLVAYIALLRERHGGTGEQP